MDNKHTCLLTKILIILIVVLLFWQITKYYQSTAKQSLEGFKDKNKKNNQKNNQKNTSSNSNTNSNTNSNIDYLKLNETYLEADDVSQTLDQFIDPWTDKTLDQCIDTCNQLDNCIGFSRNLVNDDSPANCYPRTKLGICHSNRKGDITQMQNAIKYNSYVKSNTPHVLTKCIGDDKLTLNRSIYIKSYMFPTKYIGNVGDAVPVLVDINDPDFSRKCNFRLEMGKDGIGTVSFLHIDSNSYLCRSRLHKKSHMEQYNMSANLVKTPEDLLVFKGNNIASTEDKQRVSFNILDAKKNLMRFKSLPLDGETFDKFIMVNPDNTKYVTCREINSSIDEQNMIFNIVDNITKSKVIENKNNLSSNSKPINTKPITMKSYTAITTRQTTQETDNKPSNKPSNKVNKKEAFDEYNTQVLNDSLKLDSVDDIPLYKNLFNTPTNVRIEDYLTDNYNKSFSNQFVTVNKKLNNTLINNQLDQSVDRNSKKYQEINELNKEIEKEIANLNMDLNGKNDKIINKTNNMRITDMANDYFALKSVYNGDLSK